MAEDKPFTSSVVAPITGGIAGAPIGAAWGGAIMATIGAGLAVAATALAANFGGSVALGVDGTTLSTLASSVGYGSAAATGAAVLGTVGAVGGAMTGGLSGAVTGWVNSRPKKDVNQTIETVRAQERSQGLVNTMLAVRDVIQAQELEKQQQFAAKFKRVEGNVVQAILNKGPQPQFTERDLHAAPGTGKTV